MRSLLLSLLLVFNQGTVLASWQQISYDKKYDELDGEDFLLALQRDGKSAVVRDLLPKFKIKVSEESFIYFHLWSSIATNQNDLVQLVQNTKSISARIALEKLLFWKKEGDFAKAFDEIVNIPPNYQTSDVLEVYIKLGLLSQSSEVFYQILIQGNEPSYNLLEALNTLKDLNRNLYSRWLGALKVMRPEEDLTNQLWIELSPSIGALTSAQGLRSYCRLNALYCYHAAEFLRQNGSRAEAWLWAIRIPSKKDLLKFKVHSLIDSKNYVSIAAFKQEIERHALVEEERYAYALAYALVLQNRCDEFQGVSKVFGRNQNHSYQEKYLKLKKKCDALMF
jgi:hypothetical protein